MYNYNHLYYFYVTVRCDGVTKAAKNLRVSQPSLSSQLKVLETSLDTKLFRRVGRTNQLTEAGAAIYGFCRRMFEISEEMSESISKRIPSGARRIHIGVSDEVDRTFVVEVVSLFLKKHGLEQRPKVTMISGDHERLVERLRIRELDAVVTQQQTIDSELANLAKVEVPVVLVCHSGWKSPSPTDLPSTEETQWVLPSSRFKLRAEIDRFFEQQELKGRIVFESDVIASIVRSVVDEIGVAFLPVLYVAKEIRESSLRALGPKDGYWKYRVRLLCHQQSSEDLLLQSLSRSFEDVCDLAIGRKGSKPTLR